MQELDLQVQFDVAARCTTTSDIMASYFTTEPSPAGSRCRLRPEPKSCYNANEQSRAPACPLRGRLRLSPKRARGGVDKIPGPAGKG